MDFSKLDNLEIINLYSDTIIEMKNRGIIHSNNVVGDLGEYSVVEYYNNTPSLPKLQFAPPSTKNIDAISVRGERYSIKSSTTNTTSAFFGIEKDAKFEDVKQAFEYLVIVKFDKNFKIDFILEIDWDCFFKHKKWHSRMNAYNISITKALISEGKIIYKR